MAVSERVGRAPSIMVAVMVGVVGVVLVASHWSFWMVDFAVYFAGGHAVLDGAHLYTLSVDTAAFHDMPFTYPPFAALFFSPVSTLGFTPANLLWTLLNVAAVAATLWLALDLLHQRKAAVIATPIALLLTPVLMTIVLGQLNIVLMLLVLLDFWPRLPERWRGVAIGVAAGLKLTPLIFVGYLLCVGRIKDAIRAAVAFAATVGVAFLVLPADSRDYWFGGIFFDAGRMAVSDQLVNHSIPGFMARLVGATSAPSVWVWLPLCLVVTAAGLAVAARAQRRGDTLLGVLVVAFTALLVSPVSWDHHFVWIAPALVWLAVTRHRVALVIAALWFTLPVNWLSKQLGDGFQVTPLGNLFVTVTGYVGIVAIGLAFSVTWARTPGTRDTARSAG
ncbi:glycosyltransferase 87 family protein [Amycolatopsis sp. NPDC024027]|uniref:glycosyltransferase 87 family protein n=1 Tax=Amycolatopsis sp. NPDC024027 TaxID=3154327 RepID=UPI0033C9B1E2